VLFLLRIRATKEDFLLANKFFSHAEVLFGLLSRVRVFFNLSLLSLLLFLPLLPLLKFQLMDSQIGQNAKLLKLCKIMSATALLEVAWISEVGP
jgi:hypothetical protein